jgi:hypothetical protein
MGLIKDILLNTEFHDPDLSKVRADEKRQEILDILHSEDPDHYSRLWMVGFLRFVGYDEAEVLDIIHKGNSWSGYDARTTQRHVSSIFRKNARRDGKESVQRGPPGIATVAVLPKRLISDFEPELCVIGDTRVRCYYKNCERCTLKEEIK